MKQIDLDNPFEVNIGTDPKKPEMKQVVAFKITYPKFEAFAKIAARAASVTGEKDNANAVLKRERIYDQVRMMTADSKELPITAMQLTTMPRGVSKLITNNLYEEEDKAGEVIGDGDGIDTPVHFRLGTPIAAAGSQSIEELEFIAKTYGDVERILASPTNVEQTVEMLKFLAKPVGSTLQTLPSMALAQITIIDGITILEKVLPRFLD